MDYLWAGMLFIGILYGSFTGNIQNVSDAAISAAGEAITLCITTAGTLSLWTGLMEIAKTSGIIKSAARRIRPLISFIFLSLFGSLMSKRFNLNAFETTQKLERLIAAAPNTGERVSPKNGINAPAASGIPTAL